MFKSLSLMLLLLALSPLTFAADITAKVMRISPVEGGVTLTLNRGSAFKVAVGDKVTLSEALSVEITEVKKFKASAFAPISYDEAVNYRNVKIQKQ